MKLNDIVGAATGGTEAGRRAVASFVNRYFGSVRPVTGFRVRGKEAADAVSRALVALGLEAGADFACTPSDLDPESIQVSWKTDKAKNAVGALGYTAVDQFSVSRMIVSGTSVPDIDICDLADRPVVTSVGESYASYLLRKTTEVYRRVGATSHVLSLWCRSQLDPDGNLLPSSSPIAPPAVVEAAVRVVPEYAIDTLYTPAGPDNQLFSTYHVENSYRVKTAIRMASDLEIVPAGGVLSAPLGAQLSEDCESPLNGYLCSTSEVLGTATRLSKNNAVVFVNAALAALSGSTRVSDRLLSLERALTPRYMAAFLIKAYAKVYATNVGMSYHSRYGAGPEILGTEGEPLDWESSESPRDDSMEVMAAMLFSRNELSRTFTDPTYFVPDSMPVPAVRARPDSKSDHDDPSDGLLKSELPFEWNDILLMTGYDGNGECPNSRCCADPSAVTPRVASALAMFRRTDRRPHDCAVSVNSCLSYTVDEHGDDAYTPQSAFVAGIAGILRLTVPGACDSGLPVWGGRENPAHDPHYLVSAVYTGMSTDKSEKLDGSTDVDALTEFPNVHLAGFAEPDCVDRFTRLVDRLSSDPVDSNLQFRCSSRTEGTTRTHVVVVETSASFSKFVGNDGYRSAIPRIRRLFASTVLFRNKSPEVALDSMSGAGDLDYGVSSGRFPYETSVRAEARRSGGTGADPYFGNAKVSSDRIHVLFRPDKYGRLYVVIAVDGAAGNIARVNRRFGVWLPVLTASTARDSGRAGTRPYEYVPGTEGSTSTAIGYAKHLVATSPRSGVYVDPASTDDPDWATFTVGPFFRGPYLDGGSSGLDDDYVDRDIVLPPGSHWYMDLDKNINFHVALQR